MLVSAASWCGAAGVRLEGNVFQKIGSVLPETVLSKRLPFFTTGEKAGQLPGTRYFLRAARFQGQGAGLGLCPKSMPLDNIPALFDLPGEHESDGKDARSESFRFSPHFRLSATPLRHLSSCSYSNTNGVESRRLPEMQERGFVGGMLLSGLCPETAVSNVGVFCMCALQIGAAGDESKGRREESHQLHAFQCSYPAYGYSSSPSKDAEPRSRRW